MAAKLRGSYHDLETEIKERKQAEQELRQSEGRFRVLAEALPQIVWTADAEGGVEWFNQRWYDYTGEPQGVGERWSWDKVTHPDDMAYTLKNWEKRDKGAGSSRTKSASAAMTASTSGSLSAPGHCWTPAETSSAGLAPTPTSTP